MTEDLFCVHDTDYAEYFEGAKRDGDNVFLLAENTAEKAWESEVHIGSSSYFDLPDDCWIVSGKSELIGDWLNAYNDNDNRVVERLLREAVEWHDDAIIRFFAKRKIVLQTRWSCFLSCWDEFLAIEDDCPIVIPDGLSRKEALIFRPVGDIVKIG